VQGSELVAMVGPGSEVTKVSTAKQPGSPSEQLVTVVTLVITAWSRNSPANRPYARGICEGSAVRAGELSICAGRICVPSADEAYALVLLAIGALGESVSLPR
jgi:hypothetical protein